MFRFLRILAVFAAFEAICFSLSLPDETNEIDGLLGPMDEKQIGIPTDVLLKALDSQQDFGSGRGANFFNLSAYLANPPNTTALTFIPLITLLLGVAKNMG